MTNLQKKTKAISTERFLIKWIEETRQELRQQREELRKEARITFIVAIIAFMTGLLLIFTGIAFVFIINLPISIVTAASGIPIGIVCSVTFSFYKEVNNRLFRVSNEMSSLDKNNIAMQYISRISDGKTKDQAIQYLSRSVMSKT